MNSKSNCGSVVRLLKLVVCVASFTKGKETSCTKHNRMSLDEILEYVSFKRVGLGLRGSSSLGDALNVLIVLTLVSPNLVEVSYNNRRSAGVQAVFGFAVVRLGYDTGYDTK